MQIYNELLHSLSQSAVVVIVVYLTYVLQRLPHRLLLALAVDAAAAAAAVNAAAAAARSDPCHQFPPFGAFKKGGKERRQRKGKLGAIYASIYLALFLC